MMHLEDSFPLLNARFNGLAVVVRLKPALQVLRYRVVAEME